MSTAIVAVVVSALLTAVSVGAVRSWSLRARFLDIPNDRSSHRDPTPRGGGLGIVLVVWVGCFFWLAGAAVRGCASAVPLARIGMVLAAAMGVAVISWADDIAHGLKPLTRLGVHLISAAAVLAALGWWRQADIPLFGTVQIGALGPLFTILWLVGLLNAFNFMDGIDGIAAGQAATASLSWMVIGLGLRIETLAIAAGLLLGASLAFLVYNWHPAKIFMGDVGSAFLGFSFAVVPLYAAWPAEGRLSVRLPVVGFLVMAPFVMDAALTFARRLRRGERVYEAHRSHAYQRLAMSGLGHAKVAIFYVLLGAAGGASAIAFLFLEDRTKASLVAVVGGLVIALAPRAWLKARAGRM